MGPGAGVEPAPSRSQAERSSTELPRNSSFSFCTHLASNAIDRQENGIVASLAPATRNKTRTEKASPSSELLMKPRIGRTGVPACLSLYDSGADSPAFERRA